MKRPLGQLATTLAQFNARWSWTLQRQLV